MKHRKLRIAWSVAWGMMAVLLVALWVRSYFARDMTRGCICGSHLHVSITSLKGEAALAFDEWRGNPHPWMFESVSNSENMISVFPSVGKPPLSWLGFRMHFTTALVVVILPYWFLELEAAAFASVPWVFWKRRFGLPWLPWRFRLRTLLIAMTLFAVGLGLIVWLR